MVSSLSAEEAKREARILTIRGYADVKSMGSDEWMPAELDMVLAEGDILKTGEASWVLLSINEAGEVEMEENSQLTLTELMKDEEEGTQKTLLDLAVGEILIKAKKLHTPESMFEVKTPTSVVGVRGTKFSVKVEALEE